MSLKVTRMTEADIDGAIDTIHQAFKGDPYNEWVYDHSKFNPKRNRYSLRLRCLWGISHGLFYVCRSSDSPKVLGTAMWMPPTPPSEPQSWSLYFSSWWLYFNQVYMNLTFGRGGLITKRYWIWKAAQAQAQKELWTSKTGYYFCNIVTVLPEAQGKGVGRALMEEVLREADERGIDCYLESSRDVPNVAIYEKFGFELVREMDCDDEGDKIKLYCMIRKPKEEQP
ncbi:acyl-CoA N-acyltransferase [Rhizodiscina lignyota]|uniref:Acyl-CoA N-acyltransferase n=1 Tax=Rhizodiscina lignyota TaxID=1504668 RepID=A0A9P4IRQ4_9PEZI|nr:acyl-CoA N-acyltransferase [Rhizodiscina lignyota]